MLIEILGTGCAKCELLAKHAEEAARSLGLDYQLVKVKEVPDILARGVMSTPALAVDGVVKLQGHVPTVRSLAQLLQP
ncbi:MAG TPA: thioredoxin family protein [Holophagaceae bacterium]